MDDSSGPAGREDSNDSGSGEHPNIGRTRFEVLDESGDAEESAAVTFDDGTVTVTGVVMGRNGCYTARLEDARIEDEALIVSVESYEDRAEDELCTGALVFIEYEATVEVDDGLPASVRVEHNGEPVTTSHSS